MFGGISLNRLETHVLFFFIRILCIAHIYSAYKYNYQYYFPRAAWQANASFVHIQSRIGFPIVCFKRYHCIVIQIEIYNWFGKFMFNALFSSGWIRKMKNSIQFKIDSPLKSETEQKKIVILSLNLHYSNFYHRICHFLQYFSQPFSARSNEFK